MTRRILFLLCLFSLALLAVGCAPRSDGRTGDDALPATDYRIRAELTPTERLLSVQAEIDYFVPTEGLSAIKLRLYANVYREGNQAVTAEKRAAAYPDGKEHYGGAEITEIQSSVPITTTDLGQGDTVLTVSFRRPLEKGERLSLTVSEKIAIPEIKHRLGYANEYFSLADFYPEVCPFRDGKFLTYPYAPYGDPYLRDAANFSLDLTLPKGYLCACSAPELRRETQGAFTSLFYEISDAREIACVLSRGWKCESFSVGNIPVRYYFESDREVAATKQRIAEALEFFGNAFGAFPYPAYTVAVAPFFEAGVEYSGMGVISNALSASFRRSTILHETAHQWWHGKVGSDEYRSPWMDEGLAEYAVAYFYKAKGSDAAYRTKIREAEDAYAIRLALKGAEGARFDLPLSDLTEGYYDRVYCGGLLLFSSLAEEVGTDAFLAALRDYADAFAGKVAAPNDLISSLSRSLGKDYSFYFSSWISGLVPTQ